MTKIEWTDKTWNPVTGCSKVSAGCKNCYAERMAKRLQAMGSPKYVNGFKVTCHPESLGDPLKWKKPSMVFVNSMSDLFHDDVPDSFIEQVFQTMYDAKQHTFQILTKRPGRMLDFISRSAYLSNAPFENVWLGVSVENQDYADLRIPILLETPAAVHFISSEPLLGKIDLLKNNYIRKFRLIDPVTEKAFYKSLDWVICGGETGPGARPMHPDWARSLRDQCQAASIPFFFKKWGDASEFKKVHLLDGKEYREYPRINL